MTQAGRLLRVLVPLFFIAFNAQGAGATSIARCERLLRNPAVEGYEATRVLSLKPTRSLASYRSMTGLAVLARDADGNPGEVLVRVLSDNPWNTISIIGEFNDWGATMRAEDQLHPVAGTPYYEARITGLKHGMQYRLLVNGRQLLDPAAEVYSSEGLARRMGRTPERYLNSVFWDFGRADAYKMETQGVDLRDKHVVLGETEIHALVDRWRARDGQLGPGDENNTYRFIATSGVIDELKAMGYNAIEFLPFNMSNDGAAWAFRYQVYGLFAPDSRYGTPDDFALMMDAFNKAGIGVVMDVVVGHYPYEGNLDSRGLGPIGLHQWRKADGRGLYGDDMSPWGTHRYDYANPYVRRHLIDSILTIVKRYGVSGLRFDNLDGIRFSNGGWQFLRELHEELRAYRPELWTVGEMFFGDNKVTGSMTDGGLGLNARTNSDLFDWFKGHAQGRTEDFDMEDLRRRLRNPIEWWHEGSRVDYITSHDEAANGRGGFTGQYPASLIGGGNDWWILRKTEVFEALVLASGAATMDSVQTRLLQRGNFSDTPAVDWSLRWNPTSGLANLFLAALARYVGNGEAFNFRNMSASLENHTDYDSKVISLMRTDGEKKIYVVINLSDRGFDNYAFGVDSDKPLHLVLSNDSSNFGGSGQLESRTRDGAIPLEGWGMHGKSRTAVIPYLAPMSIAVFEAR